MMALETVVISRQNVEIGGCYSTNTLNRENLNFALCKSCKTLLSDILSRLRTGLPLPASKAMELHALSRHCWSHNDKFSKRRQKNNSLYTREPYYCIEISTFSFPLPNPRLHSKGLAMEKRLRHRRIYTPRTILFACEILLPRFSLYYCFKLCEIKFINFSRSSQMSLLLS